MRILVCDTCEKRVPTSVYDHSHIGPDWSWIVVEANEDADHGQFCSWTCLAAWATKKALEKEPVGA